jgi:energy-coupling factor transporter ATP-binding protein EcfA2
MDGLHPSDEIIAWAKRQPKWRQDALRRLTQGKFTQEDEDEVLLILKQEYGAIATAPADSPITRDHLPSRGDNRSPLSLLALDQISNVNQLTEGASLAFSPKGITVIYGDNGSGKSGFVRVLKRACQSRHNERILPNVFGTDRGVASARFTLEKGGPEAELVDWNNASNTSSDLLRRMAIFDSKTAALHVDGENRVTVIPHNIDCFEKLASVSDRLGVKLNSEIAVLRRELTATLPNVAQATKVALFLLNLQDRSNADVERLCVWTPADDDRLNEVSSLLKDPVTEATRLQRILDLLVSHYAMLGAAEAALSADRLTTLFDSRTQAIAARHAASLAAADAFSSEPLAGIGDDAWRLLFEAAREYSLRSAYPGEVFPVTHEESHCVLCQQELSEPARLRFRQFADFINGAANEAAKAAEAKRDAAVDALSPAALPITTPHRELADHLKVTGLDDVLAQYRNSLSERRENAIQGRAIVPLPDSVLSDLQVEITKLESAIAAAKALASSDPGALKTQRDELSELQATKSITPFKEELIRRQHVYKQIALLEKCIRNCSTKGISDQGSKMLREHVTDTLVNALTEEQKALGIESIPLSLSGRTEKAVVQHKLRLDGAKVTSDTSHVLSEGEHRAVALAAFLSELAMYPSSDPIIIDDPVSSLDQSRRSKVAERLVCEARKRQVIVFTHDLSFLFEARFFADKETVPIRILGIRRGPKGYGTLDPDGDPWPTKSIGQRKDWLTHQLAKLRTLHAESSVEYDSQVLFFFDRLRETWERLVEEKIFAKVVGRFDPRVQTTRLDEAVVDDDIVRQVYYGMTEVSRYTGHDSAAAKGVTLPDPDEALKQLAALENCIKDVEQKSKLAKRAREVKNTPSKTRPAAPLSGGVS